MTIKNDTPNAYSKAYDMGWKEGAMYTANHIRETTKGKVLVPSPLYYGIIVSAVSQSIVTLVIAIGLTK